MKSKYWIVGIAALLVLCMGLSFWLLHPRQAGYAQIWSDGKLLHTLDLQMNRTVTVRTENGFNEIEVREGKIAVTNANCPDGHCMARGFCGGGLQIVCLPNQLVIKFLADTEIDGVVG